MEQMYEISFGRIENGAIQLEQQSGHGERDVIHLHPEQLRFIARRMAGLNESTAAKVEDLERKLSILASDINFIVKDKAIRRDIIDSGSGNEFELLARLDGLWDLAIEFDGCRLLPRDEPAPQGAPTSDSISSPSTGTPTAEKNSTKGESAGQLGLDV